METFERDRQCYTSGEQEWTRVIWGKQRCISFYSYLSTFWFFYFNVSQSPHIHIICWIYLLDISFFPIHSDLYSNSLSPRPESRNRSPFLLPLSLHYLSCWAIYILFLKYLLNISTLLQPQTSSITNSNFSLSHYSRPYNSLFLIIYAKPVSYSSKRQLLNTKTSFTYCWVTLRCSLFIISANLSSNPTFNIWSRLNSLPKNWFVLSFPLALYNLYLFSWKL